MRLAHASRPSTRCRHPDARVASRGASEKTFRVEPSEEIRRIVERWTNAVAEGDADSILARLLELGIDVVESREVELKGLDGTHRLFAVALS